MSDSNNSHPEYDHSSPSVVTRYYDVLRYGGNNLAMILMAADELMDQLPIATKPSLEEVMDVDFIDVELQTEPRIATEMLGMTPFMYLGPLVENSTMKSYDIKSWLTDATKGLIALTQADHNVVCLESDEGNLLHLSCDTSTLCPLRFLERYLTDDMYLPDFTAEKYERDPLQAMAVAVVKMQVARENDIVLPEYGSAVQHAYELKCHDLMREKLSLSDWNIKDILSS